jgi:hypothetical protein
MPKAIVTSPVEHDGKRFEIGEEIVASEAVLAALEAAEAVARKGGGKPANAPASDEPAA